jgi:hypothetical protein
VRVILAPITRALGDGSRRSRSSWRRRASTCAPRPRPAEMVSAQMLRSPLPHAPARAHGADAPTPRAAEVPLACGPSEPWPPARLPPPQQHDWARRQGCRRSGRRDRCLRACGQRLALHW